MDGTLLNSNHEVSERFFELFEILKKKNIHFVAASGRQYHSMATKLAPIKDDVLFIAENGAIIKNKGATLLTTPLDKEHLSTILNPIAKVKDAHPVLCSANNAFVNGTSDKFLNLLKEYYTQFEVVENQLQVSDEVLKVAIYHFESSEKFIYPAVQGLEKNLKVKISGANWVDISHPNAHKGYALEQVMAKYGISSNELLVFGDYNNDLEMLQLADHSYAMANAHPNVKEIANHETASNNEFGVEKIIEKMLAHKKAIT